MEIVGSYEGLKERMAAHAAASPLNFALEYADYSLGAFGYYLMASPDEGFPESPEARSEAIAAAKAGARVLAILPFGSTLAYSGPAVLGSLPELLGLLRSKRESGAKVVPHFDEALGTPVLYDYSEAGKCASTTVSRAAFDADFSSDKVRSALAFNGDPWVHSLGYEPKPEPTGMVDLIIRERLR